MSEARGPVRADRQAVPAPFAVTVAPAPDGLALIILEGEADMTAAPAFREQLERSLAEGARSVVLDVAEVSFMDSTMLRELLRAQAEVGERGGRVALAAAQPPVRRLLDLTRTTELFLLADSREAAVARAGAPAAD
jgi:anti-sigma B factor antagonist